jgi:hypothetical protein
VMSLNINVLSAFSGFLILSACTLAESVLVYNNTGAGVVIEACGKTRRLGNGLTLDVRDLCQAIPQSLSIESRGHTWHYGLPSVSAMRGADFLPFDGGANIRLRLQLQPTGQMLAVPEKTQPPISFETPQPPGFPLTPAG